MSPSDILAEHEKGASLSVDILAVLIREGVDIELICRRVQRRTLDALRLDRVVYIGSGFEFAR